MMEVSLPTLVDTAIIRFTNQMYFGGASRGTEQIANWADTVLPTEAGKKMEGVPSSFLRQPFRWMPHVHGPLAIQGAGWSKRRLSPFSWEPLLLNTIGPTQRVLYFVFQSSLSPAGRC